MMAYLLTLKEKKNWGGFGFTSERPPAV